MKTKPCIKCQQVKPLGEFYPHPAMADGHVNKCKSCVREYIAERSRILSQDVNWTLAERERHRVKSRKYRADGRVLPSPQRHKKASPDKRKAHIAVGNALRSGKLTKQPCEKCGALKVQAHHDDYSKPLAVRWLCIPHHNEHHVAERERQLLTASIL